MTFPLPRESPFHPDRPLPPALFRGQQGPLQQVQTRYAGRVARGGSAAVYLMGEPGSGKTSLAGYLQHQLQQELDLQPIYASAGRAETLEQLSAAILKATLDAEGLRVRWRDRLRTFLARFAGTQNVAGVSVHFEALLPRAPDLATEHGLLDYLREVHQSLAPEGCRGLFLVLDDLNGLAAQPAFARYIKTVLDMNAIAPRPVPVLLMICGTEARFHEMLQAHEPVARPLNLVEVGLLSPEEVRGVLQDRFRTAGIQMAGPPLELLLGYSGGFPRMVQALGDATYYEVEDDVVTLAEAQRGLEAAAEELGRKHVDRHVPAALGSADYRAILERLAALHPESPNFLRSELLAGLSPAERQRANRFLRRMQDLGVILPGYVRGEYRFALRLVQLYLRLRAARKVAWNPPS